jgi:hypothetical protein
MKSTTLVTLVEQQLDSLGYTPQWIAFDFLDEHTLTLQANNFEKDKHTSNEHYRYASFVHFLNQRIELTDEEIDRYLFLAENDGNRFMAGAAVVDLLRKPTLTSTQFDRVANKLRQFGDWAEKVIENEKNQKRNRHKI